MTLVGDIVTALRRSLGKERQAGESDPIKETLQDATQTALDAYEGKLDAMSLEGDYKRAQIANLYIENRKANAEARKLEAEAEMAEIRLARERVQSYLDLFERMGVEIGITRLPDGRLAITIGDDLVKLLPERDGGVEKDN